MRSSAQKRERRIRLAAGRIAAVSAVAFVSLVAAVPACYAAGYATAEYTGKLLQHNTGFPGASGEWTLELSWQATASGNLEGAAIHWHFSQLSGSVHATAPLAEPPVDCTASLSEKPGFEGSDADVASISQGGPGVEVSTALPLTQAALQSSEEPGPGEEAGKCSMKMVLFGWQYAGYNEVLDERSGELAASCGPEPSAAEKAALVAATAPKVEKPSGGPWAVPFNFRWGQVCHFGETTDASTIEISSKLAVGSTVESGREPPSESGNLTGALGPEFPEAKRNAAEDMRKAAIPNAFHYCLPYAGGLAMAGAGVLTLGAGPVGGMLAMTGTITSSALAPFCAATIRRVAADYKTYKDPPLASVDALARPAVSKAKRLPSCRHYSATVVRVCNRLRAAYGRLDRAAQRTAAVALAIKKTVSREHAAYDEHNQRAIKSQDKHLKKLAREAKAAASAEAAAGKTVAKILGHAHIGFMLSVKQSTKAIKLAKRKLSKEGVSATDLDSVDAPASEPAAANLLRGLTHL